MAQIDDILSHLKKHGSIEPLTALRRYGCYRLAARIYDLRARGYNIITIEQTIEPGRTYAKYFYRKGAN